MKKTASVKLHILLIFIIPFIGTTSFSQSSNDLLNLLIANKNISQEQADSIRAEAALQQQTTDAGKKSFPLSLSRALQLSGFTQIRYINTEEAGKRSGFDIRRARLDLKGSFTPYFAYRLQAEFADKPKLLDANADIRLKEYFLITIGQFKVPFSMENLASSNKLEMIDRSQVVEALVARGKDKIGNQNGRDIGIQVGGSLLKRYGTPLIEYRLGLFNGSGINIPDTANNAKDFSGRLVISPVKGFSIGGGYYGGYGKAVKANAEGISQARNRIGIEASCIFQRFSLRGEYIYGMDFGTAREGFYLQSGYFLIPQKLQISGRYDLFDSDKSKSDNISINYSLGGNYNFNAWSRIQVFYTIRAEEAVSVSNNYLAIQYQIGF